MRGERTDERVKQMETVEQRGDRRQDGESKRGETMDDRE